MAVMVGVKQTNSVKREDTYDTRSCLIGTDKVYFCMVADGHGGKQASSACKDVVLSAIVAKAEDSSPEELSLVVESVFLEVHELICSLPDCTAGSTLTVAAINVTRMEVTVWNVGDSLALLVHAKGFVPLGETHRLDDSKSERDRVVKAGGSLGRTVGLDNTARGSLRAYPGGLAVSRCVGDADCPFVSPMPDRVTVSLPAEGGAILVCSDGVWDKSSPEEVSRILLDGRYATTYEAARKIVKRCTRGGIADDTTAICVLFGPHSEPASVPASVPGSPKLMHSDVDGAPTPMDENSGGPSRRRTERRPSLEWTRSAIDQIGITGISENSDDRDSDERETSASTPHHHGIHGGGGGGSHAARLSESSSSRENSVHKGANALASGLVSGDDSGVHRARGAPPVTFKVPMQLTPEGAAFMAGSKDESVKAGNAFVLLNLAEGGGSGSGDRGGGGACSSSSSRPRATSTPSSPLAQSSEGDDDLGALERGSGGGGSPSSSACRRAPVKRGSLAGMFDMRMNAPPSTKPWYGSPTTPACEDHAAERRSGLGMLSPYALPPPQGPPRPESPLTHGGDAGGSYSKSRSGSFTTQSFSLMRNEPRGDIPIVAWEQFENLRYLGEGEFASVHASELEGSPIALKILKPTKREEPSAVKGLKREIMLMSEMEHPNVLKALALGQEHGKPFMVVAPLASVLSQELPEDADTTPFWIRWRQVRAWPQTRALKCAIQLARALAYCHDHAFAGYRVLHRDVKPPNIGFLKDSRLVLFDFGLATLWKRTRALDDEPRALTGETGSLRYMSPEVANYKPYNHKAEVFSFATVLWEMLMHKRPFSDYLPHTLPSALLKGARPSPAHGKKWSKELRELLEQCWSLDQTVRPEFHAIEEQLISILMKQGPNEAMP